MKTLIITITIILFSSCSSRTNVAANNCNSGIPGDCPACKHTPQSDKGDDTMALMSVLWGSL